MTPASKFLGADACLRCWKNYSFQLKRQLGYVGAEIVHSYTIMAVIKRN